MSAPSGVSATGAHRRQRSGRRRCRTGVSVHRRRGRLRARAGARHHCRPQPGTRRERTAIASSSFSTTTNVLMRTGCGRCWNPGPSSDAAAVVGPVQSEFTGELDPWIAAGAFFQRRRLATGTPVEVAATNNLLLDLETVRRLDLRFDPRFGVSGAEDTYFTRTLSRSRRADALVRRGDGHRHRSSGPNDATVGAAARVQQRQRRRPGIGRVGTVQRRSAPPACVGFDPRRHARGRRWFALPRRADRRDPHTIKPAACALLIAVLEWSPVLSVWRIWSIHAAPAGSFGCTASAHWATEEPRPSRRPGGRPADGHAQRCPIPDSTGQAAHRPGLRLAWVNARSRSAASSSPSYSSTHSGTDLVAQVAIHRVVRHQRSAVQ